MKIRYATMFYEQFCSENQILDPVIRGVHRGDLGAQPPPLISKIYGYQGGLLQAPTSAKPASLQGKKIKSRPLGLPVHWDRI